MKVSRVYWVITHADVVSIDMGADASNAVVDDWAQVQGGPS